MIKTKRHTLYLSLLMAMAAQVSAETGVAANDPAKSFEDELAELEEIVVTGTMIRGVAPTGTNVVSMSEQDIVMSGAATANDVLATIPQVSSNFNRVRRLPAGAAVNLSPSLRDFGSTAAPTTLVLLDGHRIINAGVLSTSPDPDVIPPGVLERVEVVTDGGSSIYGSDAVGGVINFITRKDVEGVEVSARYGVADDYNNMDFNLTAGHSWDSGSGYISYSFAGNEEIFGSDRSFMQPTSDPGGQCGGGTVSSIDPGTGAHVTHAAPDYVSGTINDCDNTADATYIPKVERHSLFGRLTQDITEDITFNLTAFYTERESTSYADAQSDDLMGSAVVCNPALLGVPGFAAACTDEGGFPFFGYSALPSGDTGIQLTRFNYKGIIDTKQTNKLESFQLTPSLTFDLPKDWQLTALATYGESTTESYFQEVNVIGQLTGMFSNLINPYDISSSDPDALNGAISNAITDGTQEMIDVRLVADGDLFSWAGGDVSMAVGVEYTEQKLKDVVSGSFAQGEEGEKLDAKRDVEAIFMEVVIPVVGDDNAIWGVNELSFSLSGRYEEYSDFGSTSNPKVGFTYSPVEAVTFRGNWGTSFVAPSLADTHAPDTRSVSVPAAAALDPNTPPASPAQQAILLIGGNADLKPQEAEIWSIGADVEIPFVPGLSFSATYYDIYFEEQIAVNTTFYTDATQEYWTLAPSQAEVEAAIAEASPYLGAPIAAMYAGDGAYSLLDFRRNNLGEVEQTGIDFNISYLTGTSFGSLMASLAGTYTIERNVKAGPGGEFVDDLKEPGNSDLSLVASLTVQTGNLTTTASWNHTAGYDVDPQFVTSRFGTQSSVANFDTVDLFFQYDLDGAGLMEGASLTLNINNVFDEESPFFSGERIGWLPGYDNSSTSIGRQAIMGIRKTF